MASGASDMVALLGEVGKLKEAGKDKDRMVIPHAVAKHFLSSAGFSSADDKVVDVVRLSVQKFLQDILADALQVLRRNCATVCILWVWRTGRKMRV